MQPLQYVVRWTDQDGKNHHKEYTDEPSARKARAWLEDKGATGIDIAVSIGSREYSGSGTVIPQGAVPGIEQQSFIK